MSKLKIRSSQLGKIMVGASFEPLPLTEVQARDLQVLLAKEKLTDNQTQTRNALIAKRDTVPPLKLSEGAKSYIEELWYESNFSFKKTFTNKFVQKGNEIESHSIRELSNYLGFKCYKNSKRFINDLISGTPDVLLNQFKTVIDAKSVYYPDGLNFFKKDEKESNLYTWQIHGYNFLTGNERGIVIRMLMNPPEHILEKEVWTAWKSSNENHDEYPSDDFREIIRDQFNFEQKKPFNERYSFVSIDSSENHFKLINSMVNLAREYYEHIDCKFKNKSKLCFVVEK